MISPTQQELLKQLGELSPDVRSGRLLFQRGFLVEDQREQSIRDVEDEQLLAVLEHHRAELERRHQPIS